MKELDEVWILYESGACLFNYAIDTKMDPVLFAGFFTAINQFGQEYAKNSIDDITMGGNLLMTQTLPEYRVSMVGRTTDIKNRKSLKKTLSEISTIFKSHFSPGDIESWDGDLGKFKGFLEFITGYFTQKEQILEKFQSIF